MCHVEVFNKELLEENFGITSYKSKTTKDGVTTWTLEVVENGETVTREVIGPKSYPQKTTMDMVNNNMSQQEIDGRNDYSYSLIASLMVFQIKTPNRFQS